MKKHPAVALLSLLAILWSPFVHADNDMSNGIIVKFGSFALSDTRQTIAGSNTTFEEDSSSVFAIEYTRRFGNNMTFGGEFVFYSNEYATFISGDMDTVVLTGNFKKYFDVAEHFQPFVGAGAGIATISVSGPFEGDAGGLAASFAFGFEIPFDHVGIHVEYKKILSTVDNETTSNQTAKFDVGGDGLFAGVAVHF